MAGQNSKVLTSTDDTLDFMTTGGGALGTVAYMSPEQALGKPLDARTDLFSFGVTLYQMATGQMPFHGDTSAVLLLALMQEIPIAPVRLNPNVPEELERIINKCLEKDRNLRYQHAADMRADLKRLQRDTESGRSLGVIQSAGVVQNRSLRWIALGAGIMAAIVVAFILWRTKHPSVQPESATSRAIAVLPLQNAGSDKDIDFLRLSLADEIATTLSRVQRFSIRPSATTSKYSSPTVDLKQAGHEMGVSSIVTGHFIKAGNQLEVTLEAVDVANDRSIWRETITVVASDNLAMQDQVTTSIRQHLIPILGETSGSTGAGTRPTNEQAYHLYLRSIAVPHDAFPNKEAISMLEDAVSLDPDYAPAWEQLGLRYYYDASYANGGKAMLKRSDEAYERALSLDENLVSAARALVTNRTDRGEIASAYAAALALLKRQPNSAGAHFALGYVLRYAGCWTNRHANATRRLP